jgi:phage-related protein
VRAVLLREINFAFGGQHCLRNYGCIYVETGGHAITPPAIRNNYEVAGISGTVNMPGVTHGLHKFKGTLFFMADHANQESAQASLRGIGAWLLSGRQKLVFDYEPLRYYLAEVDGSLEWSYGKWIEGGLDVEFIAQPYAYNVLEQSASMDTAGNAALQLTPNTGEPAPLKVVVENIGSVPITAVTVTVGGKIIAFSGMNVMVGQSLTIDMEPPIGAKLSTGASALPYATAFQYIALGPGSNAVNVVIAYGIGSRGARVTVSARGRFL